MTEDDIIGLIGYYFEGHCKNCHEDPKVKLITIKHNGENVSVCCRVAGSYRKWKREVWAKKKARDKEIIDSMLHLAEITKKDWKYIYGDDVVPPKVFRRETIQEQTQALFGFTMSNGGFRSRLKKLVENGVMEVVYFDDRSPFYSLK